MMKKINDEDIPIVEHLEVALYLKEGDVGEGIYFIYEKGRCFLNHYHWGAEEDFERNRDGIVEFNYIWDEENAKRLMRQTRTNSGRDLLKAIYKRFKKKGLFAAQDLLKYCDKYDIKYDQQVWY